MQKPGRQNKRPTYAIEAVDNALLLLQLLRDQGSLKLKQAASDLGVAPSTAHRLFAMLIYRGFALQDESRSYVPGPAMGVGPAGLTWTVDFRHRAQPHMDALSLKLNETVSIMVRVGTHVRFIGSVEGASVLRIGNRQGTVLPAALASGGKAMLAELPRITLDQLYRSRSAGLSGELMADDAYAGLLRELSNVRRDGYGVNAGETEEGVNAIGIAVHNGEGLALGALGVAIPASRFEKVLQDGLVSHMMTTRDELETDLADVLVSSPGIPETETG